MHGHAPISLHIHHLKRQAGPSSDKSRVSQAREARESPEHPTQQQGHQLHQSCGIREVKLIGLLPANRPGLQMILPTARAQTKDCDTTSQSAAAVTSHSSSVPASAQPQTCSCTHSRYQVTDLGSVSSARTQLIHRVLEAL